MYDSSNVIDLLPYLKTVARPQMIVAQQPMPQPDLKVNYYDSPEALPCDPLVEIYVAFFTAVVRTWGF